MADQRLCEMLMPTQLVYIGDEKSITRIRKHLVDALNLEPRDKQPLLGTEIIYNGYNTEVRIGVFQTLIGDRKHVGIVAKYYGPGVRETDHTLSICLTSSSGDITEEFGRGALWHSLVQHLHDKFNADGNYTLSVHSDSAMHFNVVDFEARVAYAREKRKEEVKSKLKRLKLKKKSKVPVPAAKPRLKLKRRKDA